MVVARAQGSVHRCAVPRQAAADVVTSFEDESLQRDYRACCPVVPARAVDACEGDYRAAAKDFLLLLLLFKVIMERQPRIFASMDRVKALAKAITHQSSMMENTNAFVRKAKERNDALLSKAQHHQAQLQQEAASIEEVL